MANENHRKFLVAKTELFFNMSKVADFESIEDTTKKYHEFSIDGKLAILVREEDVYGMTLKSSTKYSSSETERPVASSQREVS